MVTLDLNLSTIYQPVKIATLTTLCIATLSACAPSVDQSNGHNITNVSEQKLARHDFRYISHYQDVLGSQMHYVDTAPQEQNKPTILLLHGQPTWSYLWRNIIPHLEKSHRVIAVDLIGFGKSDKPDIDYTVEDHAKYLDTFIQQLNLNELYLGIHDWGSFLGFDYAARFPNKVKGIAFMESVMPQDRPEPADSDNGKVTQQFVEILIQLSTPEVGEKMILEDNFFIEEILLQEPGLTEDEKQAYREPFLAGANRLPMLQFPRQISFDGVNPKHVVDGNNRIQHYLENTKTPMLMLTFDPGALIGENNIKWAKANIDNLSHQHIGEGVHYVQESHPEAIGQAMKNWLHSL